MIWNCWGTVGIKHILLDQSPSRRRRRWWWRPTLMSKFSVCDSFCLTGDPETAGGSGGETEGGGGERSNTGEGHQRRSRYRGAGWCENLPFLPDLHHHHLHLLIDCFGLVLVVFTLTVKLTYCVLFFSSFQIISSNLPLYSSLPPPHPPPPRILFLPVGPQWWGPALSVLVQTGFGEEQIGTIWVWTRGFVSVSNVCGEKCPS